MSDLYLYPVGIVTGTADSRGGWTSGSPVNDFFEPNRGCVSQVVDNTLISQFENHSIQTRQRTPSYRTLQYQYEDIWAREYEMMERFYELRNGRASRFYVIDLSQQETCTAMALAGGNISASIPDTHRFSTTAGRTGYYAAAWKPAQASLVIGKMVSISADKQITFTASWGDLTAYGGDIYVYPVIECYFSDNLSNFKQGEFNPEVGDDRGYMYSGNVSFLQYGAD